ncbi:hypothetical protein OH799_02730 [Nocardia sp. NBC_00881]|uniref:hypothetical protein n=1 Tax=Nocardia sp. NBC_00881 TaxID=2975995 RepID=UPI00386D26B1|nr:hypothetical protein OH799_02730 [Nocardia sp. NBC_00881]
MPLTVNQLRVALQEAAGAGYLRMAASEFGLEPALELFQDYLTDSLLELRNVTVDDVDVDGLTIVGSISLLGQAASRAEVEFLADDAEQLVTGVWIDAVLLPDGRGLPDFLTEARDVLAKINLGQLHLVLGIEAGTGTYPPRPVVGFGAEILFPDSDTIPRPYIWGAPPMRPGQSWQFRSEFDEVAIPDLDTLLRFFGLPPTGFDIPGDVLGALALRALAIVLVTPEQSRRALAGPRPWGVQSDWRAMRLEVSIDKSWNAIPGIIIEDPHAVFSIADPFGACHVASMLGGIVTLADDVTVEVGVSLPRRFLQGRLVEPVPIGPLLDARFDGIVPAPLANLTLEELELWAELAQGPNQSYGLEFTLAGVWSFTEGIELSGITLRLADVGGVKSGEITGIWTLADGALDVTGSWAPIGWEFSAHAIGIEPATVMSVLGITPPSELEGLTIDELALRFGSDGVIEFLGDARFALGDKDAQLLVQVSARRGEAATIGGELRILAVPEIADAPPRELVFAVTFQSRPGATGSQLVARWEASADAAVPVLDLLAGVGVDTSELRTQLPDLLWPQACAAVVGYDTGTGTFALTVDTEHAGVLAAAVGTAPNRAIAVLVAGKLEARLSNLPLVGTAVPADRDIVLTDVGFSWASKPITSEQATAINQLL